MGMEGSTAERPPLEEAITNLKEAHASLDIAYRRLRLLRHPASNGVAPMKKGITDILEALEEEGRAVKKARSHTPYPGPGARV